MFTLGDQAISWRNIKQSYIVDLTMEAKYLTTFEAAKEIILLWKFLMELQVVPMIASPIATSL